MNKALFLDRDGIINKDAGYTYKPSEFEVVEGITSLCKEALIRDYILIIITNQSGIGRGYYTEEQFWEFMNAIEVYFKSHGIFFTKIYFSAYHPESKIEKYKTGAEFRKPNPGMLLQAEKDFNINLGQSIFIGDKLSDVQAGLNAGVGRNILFTGVFENIF